MRRGRAFVLATLLLIGVAPRAARSQANFTGRMDGAQETPAVVTSARGTITATLTSAGLGFYITVRGLSGPIIAAHIHSGAPGVAGGVVRDITAAFGGTNSATGAWLPTDASPLSAARIADLMAGNLYVNVHTSANPGGEMRGQLRLSAGAHFTANLQGPQENPAPAGVTATGAGSFTLTEEGLEYKITVNGLTGAITAAHLHTGSIGVSGPIVFDLLPSFTGNTATGFISGLTTAQKNDLLASNMYVNIHTATNAGGEIRGQLNLAGGIALSGPMDAGQETPPTGASGLGTVSATLTPLGLLVRASANGLSGAITGARLHDAAAGVAGPVVRTVAAGEFLSGGSIQLVWRFDDAEPLTPALVSELLKGNVYLNLHTAANPGGEIRAQLNPALPSSTATASFTAAVATSQERPSPAANAHGTGSFVLTPAGLAFRMTLEGTTGPPISAHIHTGAIGVNGGVTRLIAAGEFLSSTTIAGIWTSADAQPLTAAAITDLIKGNLYFNAHTTASPGGEMRGQILPASGGPLEARFTGAQETPSTGATGLGTGSFTLTQHGLEFNVTFDGLTGSIIAGHFHGGAPGVAGSVARAIAAGEMITANTLAGVWKPTDTSPLTAAFVTEMLKGNMYMNVHTSAFPGGELRGQIVLAGGHGTGERLTGAEVVPPVAAPGRGTAATTLTDQGMVFRLTADMLQGTLNGAHVHQAPAGANGPVVRDILSEIVDLTGDGVWKPTDSLPLTGALMAAVLSDGVYLDLHSTAFADGELRGQSGEAPTLGVDSEPAGPVRIQLAAVPNPVGGDGVLRFFLTRAARARVTLHDVAGAEVARLSDAEASAGWHRVPFDASGLRLGVYFARVSVEGATGNAKVLVLR